MASLEERMVFLYSNFAVAGARRGRCLPKPHCFPNYFTHTHTQELLLLLRLGKAFNALVRSASPAGSGTVGH